jgi:acetoin utilization protein AcuB
MSLCLEAIMFVRSYMTPDPLTASPDTNFPQAMNLIRRHKIRCLPVLDEGRLVGIVVHADLLSNQPSPIATLRLNETYSLLETIRMRQIMSRPVITVEGDCPLEEAARIMVENNISSLPVMDGNKLVGIITETVVFKALVELLGGEQAGFRLTLRLPERIGGLADVTGRVAASGGNILALTTSRLLDETYRMVTIKETGADRETLLASLKETGAEVLDVRESARYQPRRFG